MTMTQFKLGLVINPFAGIGGSVALKGSDGAHTRDKALALGATKLANSRTRLALQELLGVKDCVHIYTAGGEMGEALVAEMGFEHTVVYQQEAVQSEPEDTERCVHVLQQQGVDLLLFAGGDGTARNVCHIVGESIPVLGVPAGCKIHSGVYAVTPQAAGRVVAMMVNGEIVTLQDADVMDIDETLFRQGRVNARQYGEMRVPSELRYIQAVKMGGKESDELVLADIAAHVIEFMDEHPERLFVMGSGSTVDFIMQELGLKNTLLGVDIVQNQQVVAHDVTASTLLEYASHVPVTLVITLIGGQGHIFGRGNQQLSPEVLKKIGRDNLLLVATKSKLQGLKGKPLIADTGDITLDAQLAGVISVTTGYKDQVLYPIAKF
ncbi:ATP-NAD/AcoX kinase [Paraglaciecola sp. T6c]|uniref:ATP-NAD kinase family protein n=1 Tax=Pseudoalteromonas atlantica (strain T6c / ATCC BAA-1087) TaxID=3042615 RepID=UPI00005C6C43|nr:ATP-NAD kinase family protein [Paraglaciecola sp. T6c]ABG41892.1 ATP-NAD/AcoX kinase [Paraglaciecola sp. T6c]